MSRDLLLYPVFALVALTVAVWFALYRTRVREIRRQRLSPQALASRAQAGALLQGAAGPSDNLLNLFELPVLFYVLTALLYAADRADAFFVSAAWVFVLLRAAHSFIHCTYNRVWHRFLVYVLSSMVLWAMWLVWFWRVVGA